LTGFTILHYKNANKILLCTAVKVDKACILIFIILYPTQYLTNSCSRMIKPHSSYMYHFQYSITNASNRTKNLPAAEKLNMGGRGFPLGRRVDGCRSSSKYGWTHASSGARRRVGVYSNSCPTRSIASDDVRGLNTYKGKCTALGSCKVLHESHSSI